MNNRENSRRNTACWLLVLMAVTALGLGRASGLRAAESSDGPGIQVRGGHVEGQGVPQVRPLTPVEIFPFWLENNSLFFGDVRFFATNDAFNGGTADTYGGNAGIGYRYYSPALDRVFGVSGWYDGDNTREVYFQQVGLNLETYAWLLDARANLYLPVGHKEQEISLTPVPGGTRFVGDNLFYDLLRSSYVAMQGFDAEVGIPLPSEFAEQHGIRLYGGGYSYEDDIGNTISGWSSRLQANVWQGLDAQVQVTHDDFYDTRAFAGVSWTFGRLHPSQLKRESAFNRIGEHIQRNYTVLAPQRDEVEHLIAVDPQTGSPYTFAHVASAAPPGGTGGVSDPFQTIAEAQAANRDIVFVHAGTVFNGLGPIVLASGERILGDGAGMQHFVQVPLLGQLLLPSATPAGPLALATSTMLALPFVQASTGDAVVLSSHSEFSGFRITGAGGNGIVADGVQDAVLRGVSVDGAGGAGLHFVNNSGTFTLENIAIANTAGKGIEIQGGTAAMSFGGVTSVSHAGGPSVSIKDVAAAGVVNFATLGIDHRQDRGFEIDNLAGAVNITSLLTISNEANVAASAMDMRNSPGNVNIATLEVTDATGAPGVNLENNSGTTTFSNLKITSAGGTALKADHIGALNVNPAVDGVIDTSKVGTINAVNGTAIDIKNSNLNISLTSVSASNAPVGLSLIDTSGTFVVLGNAAGEAGSGGVISNTATAIFLQNTGTTLLEWMTLTGNGVGMHTDNSADLTLLHTTLQNSTGFGIDAMNTTTLRVIDVTMTGNGAANVRAQFDRFGSYAYRLQADALTSSSGDNVVIAVLSGAEGSTMNLVASGGTIENTLSSSAGLKVDWNGTLSASVDDVTFKASGGANAGAVFHNAATAAVTAINFTNSDFKGTGGQDTGLQLITAGPSQINVTGNTFEFDNVQGNGIRLSLGPSATVNLSSNHIFDTVDGTNGIKFDSIAGPSSVTMDGNLIELKNSGNLLDQGIVFASVTNSIQLIGTSNNSVTNSNLPFFVPAGASSGGIVVNGVFVP